MSATIQIFVALFVGAFVFLLGWLVGAMVENRRSLSKLREMKSELGYIKDRLNLNMAQMRRDILSKILDAVESDLRKPQ